MERARRYLCGSERDTPLGRWAKALLKRAHLNVAVVASADKLARIAWGCCGAENGLPSRDRSWRRSEVAIGRLAPDGAVLR